MKSTQTKRNVHGHHRNVVFGTQRNLYSTVRWGFKWGVTQILKFAFGVTQILGVLDTNMLVVPARNFTLGDPQHKDPTQMFLHCSGI